MTTKNLPRGLYYIHLKTDVAYDCASDPELSWELPIGSIVIAAIETNQPTDFPDLGVQTIANIPNQKNPRDISTKTLYRYENADRKDFTIICEVPSYQEFDDLREEAADA